MGVPDTEQDFNQWLDGMRMVSQLPGGMPPEFRRKVNVDNYSPFGIGYFNCVLLF